MMVAGSLKVYEPYVWDFWSGFRLRRSMNGSQAPGVGVEAGVWHQGGLAPLAPAAVFGPGTMVRSQSESLLGSVTGVPSGLRYFEPGASTVRVPNRPWLTRPRLLAPGCT